MRDSVLRSPSIAIRAWNAVTVVSEPWRETFGRTIATSISFFPSSAIRPFAGLHPTSPRASKSLQINSGRIVPRSLFAGLNGKPDILTLGQPLHMSTPLSIKAARSSHILMTVRLRAVSNERVRAVQQGAPFSCQPTNSRRSARSTSPAPAHVALGEHRYFFLRGGRFLQFMSISKRTRSPGWM